MTIRVDEVCFWYAEEGPAELKTSQVDGRAKSLEGYTISDLEDLVKRVRAAYANKIEKVEREDLLIWDKLARAWVEVSPELDLSTFVVRFGTGDKSRLTLCVGLRPVKKDGLEVEVFQSGLDYIHSDCGQLPELVACALNSIRSDAIRAGRSVPAHFQHYTSPAFNLRLGFNPTKLNDLNFNVDSEKVTVIHRYGTVRIETDSKVCPEQKQFKGGFEAKLNPNPAKFEASSDKSPYSIESLRELSSGEEKQTYRRDERRLLVIAVQSVKSDKEKLKQLVKLEVGKALKFKEDSGPVFLAFAPLRELGFSMARLMEMVPFRLRSYLQTLLCADSPERAEKGCVIVTDGSSDCSWCQIFPASCLDSETETICCVPCVLQYYPHKVKEGLFDDEAVRTIATSGLQEFWHAWAWILQHSKPTGFLNELQLKRLKTRLQVLENGAITCHLSARDFFANASALVH